jgi:DNA-binding transcriptional LysR family regulator
VPGDVLIRQLEYLVALAREEHFGRAAAACHASQSALSAAVRKLETSLGVKIVQRGHRFAGFTPEGHRVLGWARQMLTDSERLRADLEGMRRTIDATLRLEVIPTADPATPLLTAPFRARYPMAQVHVEVLPSEEILRRLAHFELDAALTYLQPAPPEGALAVELYRERYLLLTPDDGPLAHQDRVTYAEAAVLPLCALTATMESRRILDRAAAGAGVELEPVFEADSMDAIYAHIATRRWSGIVAHTWLHVFGVPDGMRALPLAEPSPHPAVGLIALGSRPVPMLVRALFDIV